MDFEQSLFIAISACAAAIVHLYARLEKKTDVALASAAAESARISARLDECDRDRRDLRDEINSIKVGCHIPKCPLKNQHQRDH